LTHRQEQRLLNLVMSQILDQGVAGILSQVIYQISTTSTPAPTTTTTSATPQDPAPATTTSS
jgi:hypothetical protein